ncbi:lysophospholipid acyltransferase family protein [Humisphaera borealis]|uniref:1-acyl-sn-glycerol-3-phosphate acyltransferase n=1 Tax=Humisphaera borealis TaxID=2807512 RepID=A0A7M2WRC1_9BACT|nr:lysophospholipid acyltransferase family protein [Humisphaera borealis]QOV87361.1 1-acyl-sn-glycerol-3-phosphate acyltransferase [Humisphaera borealis]
MSSTNATKKSKPSDERGTITSRILRAGNRVYARTFHRIDVQTPCRLPRTGPAILVCNHISGLDPLLLQAVIPRPIVWMMAREYYDIAALRWVYQAVDAIPVERNGRDSSATRAALRALGSGRVLGVFPEGRIETSRELLPFHTGVAMMATRAEVPVVPAYLDGSNRGMEMLEAFVEPNDVKLRFGPAVDLAPSTPGEKIDLNICTSRIFDSVSSLKKTMAYA